MTISTGTRLGRYEVIAPIGRGGMGEVYRARDTKLGRDVAVKVLPEEFAEDPDRLARFEREAKLLASLNHPNIAAIYGFEESDGINALVLELVEGPTLAERIAEGPIPVDEAITIAKQIAEALEAGHEAGVIHRDLKPANIKLKEDGTVKVLDYGLAKALEGELPRGDDAELSQSPTLTRQGTQVGVILGTAAYMSPEQAKGKRVDKRSDIFAFGSVLYECLTANKAFEGETIAETLGSILHKDPDWVRLPPSTPPNVRRVLQRCLEKNTRQRMRDIGDVALDLTDRPAESAGKIEQRHRIRWLSIVPVILLLLAAYLAGVWRSTPPLETVWIGERLGGPTVAGFPVVSPDDSLIAFLVQDRGLTQVAVMQPGGSGGSRQLTHDRSRGYAGIPAWSPDSSRIYFDRTGPDGSSIYSIAGVGDAEERLVLEGATDPRPLPDGSLLVVRHNSEGLRELIRYRYGTNDLDRLPVLLARGALFDPPIKVVPGGQEVVVAGRPEDVPSSENHLYVIDLGNGSMRRIAPDVTLPFIFWEFPLSVTSDEAYFSLPAGDLHQIVAARLDGTAGVRSVLSLTRPPLGIDVDRSGTVYLDQIDQPTEILRFDTKTGEVEQFPLSMDFRHVLPLPGDRFLVAPRIGSRDRLMVVAPPNAPLPFLLDSDEEARGPLAMVGVGSVAFLIGPAVEQQLGLASIDGRLKQRVPIRSAGGVTGLAASPDGSSLYYAADGVIHHVSIAGGYSKPISRGEEIAVDPSNGDLVILRWGDEGQLVRVPAVGGAETSIAVDGDWRVHGLTAMMGNSISSDGRLVVRTLPPASWLFPVGILDSHTGGPIAPFVEPADTDMYSGVWDSEERVVALAHPFRSELWRFRPASAR